jgi:hypothetical protein
MSASKNRQQTFDGQCPDTGAHHFAASAFANFGKRALARFNLARQKTARFFRAVFLLTAYWPPVNRRDHHPARRGAGSPAGSGGG